MRRYRNCFTVYISYLLLERIALTWMPVCKVTYRMQNIRDIDLKTFLIFFALKLKRR